MHEKVSEIVIKNEYNNFSSKNSIHTTLDSTYRLGSKRSNGSINEIK